jgi:hypothetical protein
MARILERTADGLQFQPDPARWKPQIIAAQDATAIGSARASALPPLQLPDREA